MDEEAIRKEDGRRANATPVVLVREPRGNAGESSPCVVEEMQTHLFRYNHKGKTWQIGIVADDEKDAKDRLQRLAFASYLGVSVMTVPVWLSPIVPAIVWLRNAAVTWLPRFGFSSHR